MCHGLGGMLWGTRGSVHIKVLISLARNAAFDHLLYVVVYVGPKHRPFETNFPFLRLGVHIAAAVTRRVVGFLGLGCVCPSG